MNRSNAASLHLIWYHQVPTAVTASLIAVDDTLYFGSWDGMFYALNATNGVQKWSTRLTNEANWSNGDGGCKKHGAIFSTPTYFNGRIYETAGDSNLSAMYPSNGTIAWNSGTANSSTNQTASPWYHHSLWSSPIVFGNYAYVGPASTCDGYLVQGQLLQVPLSGSG